MEGIKSVRFEDVETMMDEMMRIPIFRESEKRDMSSMCWNNKRSNDPNIIMDLRHKTIGEKSPSVLPAVALSQSSVVAEVTRMLMIEESQALYRKREQDLFKYQLKKFEKAIDSSRPGYRGGPYYTCTNRRKIRLLDEDYVQLMGISINNKSRSNADALVMGTTEKVKANKEIMIAENIEESSGNKKNSEDYYNKDANIKVTIKDKQATSQTTFNKDQEIAIKQACFRILMTHAREERRLRDLRIKIEEKIASKRLRKYFSSWKERMINSKRLALAIKKEKRMSTDERKIELFVNAINEKQKKLAKQRSSAELTKEIIGESLFSLGKDETLELIDNDNKSRTTTLSTIMRKRMVVVGSPPIQSHRLDAQKKIIALQKIKLAEQEKIIEELRLKEIEKDNKKNARETINVAKEALLCCGGKTRRSLMQLMRQDPSSLSPHSSGALSIIQAPPGPPKFLARMEARAKARKERIKRLEEERKQKLEEEQTRESIERRLEEENRKRLKLEAQREAKRIREEEKNKRKLEEERLKAADELSERFYRKYLLRRYVMKPLAMLLELKRNRMKKAIEHFNNNLLTKILVAWQKESNNQRDIKMELATSMWRRNLLWYVFGIWREAARIQRKKTQVAMDFYEMRLQERCIKNWLQRTISAKIRESENDRLVKYHIERRLKLLCFRKWRDFLNIADEVRERDRMRDQWRQLVQRVVPDFDPKQRGVIIDD